MRIGSQIPIDPTEVKIHYQGEGLRLSLLNKCNSMEFRTIGGAGEGHFLLDDTQIGRITTPTITFQVRDSFTEEIKNFTVRVLEKLSLHPKEHTGDALTILRVAEEKYDLMKRFVARNYNLIKRDEIEDGEPINFWEPDDVTLKTLETILTDISALTVNYLAAEYIPLECNIQGMDVLSAIDLLCAAYGLLWTVHNGTLTVYDLVVPEEHSEKDISDIYRNLLTRSMASLKLTYPVVSDGTQRNSRVVREQQFTSQGVHTHSYMPFLPAIVFADGEVLQNNTDLTALVGQLQPNFEGVARLEGSYLVYHSYKLDVGSLALHFQGQYADYGSGPRTIFDARNYPYLTIPQPYTFDRKLDPSPGTTILAVFELTAPLSSGIGFTAAANVIVSNSADTPTTITVRNTGMSKGYTGARGIAVKVQNPSTATEWWVIEVDQFCLQYTAKMVNSTHSFSPGGSNPAGSYADQSVSINTTDEKRLTPYPFSFYEDQTITNPFNFHAIPGDTILVAHVEDGYSYLVGDVASTSKNIIIAVFPANARKLVAMYTENVPHGDYQPTTAAKGWAPIGNNSGGLPLILPAVDKYHLSYLGRTNMFLDVQYDFVFEQYVITNSQHWATRVKASFATSFCAAASTFQVDVLEGMNGLKPTGPLTVQNRYGINYAQAGDYLDVMWDQIEGVWYPERTLIPTVIIEYTILTLRTEGNTANPFFGLKIATVLIHGASCPSRAKCLVGNTVDVVDHSGCTFDEEEMAGYTGWATNMQFWSLQEIGYICETMSNCHWAAFNRCCAPNTGTYSEACPEP